MYQCLPLTLHMFILFVLYADVLFVCLHSFVVLNYNCFYFGFKLTNLIDGWVVKPFSFVAYWKIDVWKETITTFNFDLSQITVDETDTFF